MRNTFITIICVTCLWAGQASARIYKHVDKDGNITYTDVPTSTSDKAVKETPMTTFKPVPVPTTSSNKKPEKSNSGKYDSLTITSPKDNDVIRANGGTITVDVRSLPGLDVSDGHEYVILVDGKAQQTSQSNSISVSDLARGKHSLSVQIKDKDNQVLASSTPVHIDILRTSVQNPNHP